MMDLIKYKSYALYNDGYWDDKTRWAVGYVNYQVRYNSIKCYKKLIYIVTHIYLTIFVTLYIIKLY